MQTNIIQLIEDCLKNSAIGPSAGKAFIGGGQEVSVSVYPQELCLETLLQNYHKPDEVSYALGCYHKIRGNSEVSKKYFLQAGDILQDNIKTKINNLINTYCI